MEVTTFVNSCDFCQKKKAVIPCTNTSYK